MGRYGHLINRIWIDRVKCRALECFGIRRWDSLVVHLRSDVERPRNYGCPHWGVHRIGGRLYQFVKQNTSLHLQDGVRSDQTLAARLPSGKKLMRQFQRLNQHVNLGFGVVEPK